MSVPFGKWKKSLEQNVMCFLSCVNAYIDDAKSLSYNQKAKKKFPKYMKRMNEIMAGNNKKFPCTLENLRKIAHQFGQDYLTVNKMILEMNLFSLENK